MCEHSSWHLPRAQHGGSRQKCEMPISQSFSARSLTGYLTCYCLRVQLLTSMYLGASCDLPQSLGELVGIPPSPSDSLKWWKQAASTSSEEHVHAFGTPAFVVPPEWQVPDCQTVIANRSCTQNCSKQKSSFKWTNRWALMMAILLLHTPPPTSSLLRQKTSISQSSQEGIWLHTLWVPAWGFSL